MSESLRAVPTFIAERAAGRASALRPRRAARPTAGEWARHAALFLLTGVTALWAGLGLMVPLGAEIEPVLPAPSSVFESISYVPLYYFEWQRALLSYALAHTEVMTGGALFACSLLSILLAHEAGHYVACRRYGVDATLPFFIPMPPPFLAGTLGAFIKIKSPIPTRRALFDIGVAGPLAGFIVLVPIALLAMWTAKPYNVELPTEGVLIFNDPPMMKLLAALVGVSANDLANLAPNPFYWAAWVGLLVTSLNLMPVGQLDGGHATYSLFGPRAHAHIGRAAFLTVIALVPLGWLWHGSPGGAVYALLLYIMLRFGHPRAEDESEPLGRARLFVALATLAVFLLSFTPFPVTVL
ncbi:MAG TPA: site-2 protease family protein [Pyrinomonadaceae bacterium]|nr:site-2 protease family protein [Pyrinomonadaceae bacterium]